MVIVHCAKSTLPKNGFHFEAQLHIVATNSTSRSRGGPFGDLRVLDLGGPSSSMLAYCTRVLPAVSILLVAALTVTPFFSEPFEKTSGPRRDDGFTGCHYLLSFYIVLLHLISVAFPASLLLRTLPEQFLRMLRSTESGQGKTGSTRGPACRRCDFVRPTNLCHDYPILQRRDHTLQNTLTVLAAHLSAATRYHVRSSPKFKTACYRRRLIMGRSIWPRRRARAIA